MLPTSGRPPPSGAALAEIVPAGNDRRIVGTLGAGKTRLVQAIAEAWWGGPARGGQPDVRAGPRTRPPAGLPHRRLSPAGRGEFEALGPDKYFESDALVLVEWADRVAGSLPAERIDAHRSDRRVAEGSWSKLQAAGTRR